MEEQLKQTIQTTQIIHYICPLHKTEQTGIYRESFDDDLHEEILNASINTVMELYKVVKHGCHCQSNYAEFDKLRIKDSKQTSI
jgi:hypothetical protein